MAADIKDSGGLAEVVRYGIPWHGRIEGGVLYTGKLDPLSAEVTRAFPQPDSSDCWLVKRPGLADPYATDAAQKAADALEGKELTNWALLAGAGDIHGKAFTRTATARHRWLWVDAAGEAYSVTFGLVAGTAATGEADYDGFASTDYAFADAITARFSFTRYGRLEESGATPAASVVVDHVIAAGSLGQAAPAITVSPSIGTSGVHPDMSLTAGNLILRDLTPTGSDAIMEVHSLVFDSARNRDLFGVVSGKPYVSHREMSNPLGFVKFSLSGTGAAPSVAMSVLATRAQALGAYAQTRPSYSLTSGLVCSGCLDGVCTTACGYSESWRVTTEVAGRIIGYRFDALGAAQPVALTATHHEDRADSVSPPTLRTVQLDNTLAASITVAANTLAISYASHYLQTLTYDGSTCTSEITTSATTDSGIPEWTQASSTTTGAGDCSALYWSGTGPQASCGTACRTDTPFVAEDMTVQAFLLPSGIDFYDGRLIVGAFRFGSGLFSLFGGHYSDNGMGSTGLVNADLLQKSYAAWNPTRIGYSRLYGAWNPATLTLSFPKSAPVNFA